MVRRLDHIVARQGHTASMASGAVTWRSFENTPDVARLTFGRSMRAAKRESGFQMIKVANRGLRHDHCSKKT
jgi:hypothetical protein